MGLKRVLWLPNEKIGMADVNRIFRWNSFNSLMPDRYRGGRLRHGLAPLGEEIVEHPERKEDNTWISKG